MVNLYIVYSIPDITYASGLDIIKHCLFGATAYNIKIWLGYGVAFGKQPYSHKDSGKNTKNLIILGANLSDSSDDETKKKIS